MLEPQDAAEQRRDRSACLAELALPDCHAKRIRAARRLPRIDGDGIAARGLQDAHGLRFGADRADVLAVGLMQIEGDAMLQRVVQHVLAHGDGGAGEHRVHVNGTVVAHVFAERPFRLDVAALVEIALESHLGVGRH
jgi:hypothetical protein